MRFGLSDLDELPSLKEFEALAREALGTDDGVAEGEAVEEPSAIMAAEETGTVQSEASAPAKPETLIAGDTPAEPEPGSEAEPARQAARGGAG